MNKNKFKDLIGIFFVIVGILWLLENFDLIILGIPFGRIIFNWHTFAIIFGLIFLSKNSKSFAGYFFISIGLIGLFRHLSFLPIFSFLTFGNLWPLIIILAGIWLILNYNHNKSEKKNYFDFNQSLNLSNENIIDETIQFDSQKKIIRTENFSGGKISVMFGELKLDLSQSKLNEGENILDFNVMFGSLELRVPTDWKINTSISATFGGIDDKRIASLVNIHSNSSLHIKGSVTFAGCEIFY